MNLTRLKTINAVGWLSIIVTTALCAVDELNLQGAGIVIPGWVFKALAVINATMKTVNTHPATNQTLPAPTPTQPEPLDRLK